MKKFKDVRLFVRVSGMENVMRVYVEVVMRLEVNEFVERVVGIVSWWGV